MKVSKTLTLAWTQSPNLLETQNTNPGYSCQDRQHTQTTKLTTIACTGELKGSLMYRVDRSRVHRVYRSLFNKVKRVLLLWVNRNLLHQVKRSLVYLPGAWRPRAPVVMPLVVWLTTGRGNSFWRPRRKSLARYMLLLHLPRAWRPRAPVVMPLVVWFTTGRGNSFWRPRRKSLARYMLLAFLSMLFTITDWNIKYTID